MKKSKKIAAGVIASIAVIAGGIILAKKIVSSASSDETFYIVRNETYENVIEIAGTVNAAKSQSLMSRNDGTVVGVYKKEGDEVKAGDLIVQLDDTEQVYNLANTNYEIGVARISQTSGKLNLLLSQRKSLVQKVADRKITATFDGIIASLDVDTGDYLEAKDSVGTLVDTSYLTAEVEIAETDVGKLKVGQKVEFTFPAYDGTVEGYVVSYPTIGEVTSRGATVVKAEVRIDDVPEGILPNFSFTGKIQITEPVEKLIVERYAIGYSQGNSFVEIVEDDGKTVKVEVKVEPYTMDYVNVLSGLEGGERLKAQSSAEKSGRLRMFKKGQNGKSNKNKNKSDGPGGGFGAPPF